MNHFKKSKLKLFLAGLMLVSLFSSFVSAQKKTTPSGNWELLFQNDKVEIFYTYQDCNFPARGTNHENVYLKIKNKSASSIQVKWRVEYWYNNKCIGCEPGHTENIKDISLQANETKTGSCSETGEDVLKLFSKSLNGSTKTVLSKFELKEITVSIIQ